MLKVKIADNPYTLEKGLMFVEHLPEDEGMLFVFGSSRILNFWGKNTLIPLDIAFIENNKIVKIKHIKTLDLNNVSSEVKCSMALEVNKGYFSKNKIYVGSSITIDKPVKMGLPFDEAVIYFNKGENLEEFTNTLKKTSQDTSNNKIGRPDDVVGVPINTEEQTLPVVDSENIGEILEDDIIEEETGTEQHLGTEVTQLETAKPEEPKIVEPTVKEYPLFDTAYAATEWAEKNGEVIRISYVTKHGKKITRDIEPHGKFHSDSTYRQILVAWDQTIGNIRAFIVTNIYEWAFVGKKFNKKFMVRA